MNKPETTPPHDSTTSATPPERAVATLRQTQDVPDSLLAHLSPLGWEHINLTGDYVWSPSKDLSENYDGLMPLRAAPDVIRKAA